MLWLQLGRRIAVGIRELRQRKLLSQRELAEKAGVSETTIVKLELGATRPQPRTLRKIAEALGIETEQMADLMAEVGKAAA
jgi:transcriptional regulator with XRE-family HTH domain